MSQASSSWKWRWQVILPSLTVISALVGAPPPATQLFPIVLKPRYAHFIFTSIIILLLFWHKSGGAIREQTTCTARPANASSYLCLICVLVLPNLLSLSVPPNNCKKTNATNRTVKKDYPPQIPSYYSTSNVSLVCCQRYFEANWYKKLNRGSSFWGLVGDTFDRVVVGSVSSTQLAIPWIGWWYFGQLVTVNGTICYLPIGNSL